jgi:hypothetical protein
VDERRHGALVRGSLRAARLNPRANGKSKDMSRIALKRKRAGVLSGLLSAVGGLLMGVVGLVGGLLKGLGRLLGRLV